MPQTSTHGPLTPSSLHSPLETLLESWEDILYEWITLNDISEAYNILCNRLQPHAEYLLHEQLASDALEPIRRHSSKLRSILCRDIGKSRTHVISDMRPSLSSDFGLSPIPISDDQFQHATDLSIVSQHALRFASYICTFPALYSSFSVNEIDDILNEIFLIVAIKVLPTPGALKTYTLAIYILSTQRLPASFMQPRWTGLVRAIERAIKNDFGSRAAVEGLQAVRRYLQLSPKLFIRPFSALLPLLLDTHLISTDRVARLHASQVLNQFALLKLSAYMDPKFPHDTITTSIKQFISSSGSKTAAEMNPDHPSLYFTVIQSAQDDSGPPSETGTVWGLIVVASFLILLGDGVFSHPASLRLFERFIGLASVPKKASTRALFAATWRCLVWCYAKLCWSARRDHKLAFTKQKAFSVLKDAGLKHTEAISVSLLVVTLSDGSYVPHAHRHEELVKGISVLKGLACSSRPESRNQAVEVLSILVGCKTAPGGYDDSTLIDIRMFDGSILSATLNSLPHLTKGLMGSQLPYVSALAEEEVREQWDALIEVWKSCMEHTGSEETRCLHPLLQIWRRLLLTQVQTTPAKSQSLEPSLVARRISRVLCSLLAPAESRTCQVAQLNLVSSLWSELKRTPCSSPNWLSGPAQVVIAELLRSRFEVRDDGVRRAWSSLSAELIETGIPALVHILAKKDRQRSQHGELTEEFTEVKYLLWSLLAKTYGECGDAPGASWEDIVSFLTIPFGAWTMSEEGYDLWHDTLRSAFLIAGPLNIKPIDVIEHLIHHLGEDRIKALSASPKYLLRLLPHINLSPTGPGRSILFPTDLLTVLNDVLLTLYPPTHEELSVILDIFLCLTAVIDSVDMELVLYFIGTMKSGLCVWLTDEKEALTDAILNRITVATYIPLLGLLQRFYHRYIAPFFNNSDTSSSGDAQPPPILQVLHYTADFLTATFRRILEPATGPMAFIEFWKVTFGRTVYSKLDPKTTESLPVEIQNCLRACEYAWKVDLGFTSGAVESQESMKMSIPDSQSLAKGKYPEKLGESWVLRIAQQIEDQQDERVHDSMDVDPPTALLPPLRPPQMFNHPESLEADSPQQLYPDSSTKPRQTIASRLKAKPRLKKFSTINLTSSPLTTKRKRTRVRTNSAIAALQEYSSQVP